jgi:hypothetical protein
MKSEENYSKLKWIHDQCNGIFQDTFWANKGLVQSPDISPFQIISDGGITRIDDKMKTTFSLHFGDIQITEKGKKFEENTEGIPLTQRIASHYHERVSSKFYFKSS